MESTVQWRAQYYYYSERVLFLLIVELIKKRKQVTNGDPFSGQKITQNITATA